MKATSRLVLLVAAVAGAGCQPESTAPDAEPASAAAELVGGWTTRAPYPRSEWGAASAAVTNPSTLRSTLYVIGGAPPFSGPGRITDAVKAYDVEANTWKPKAHYPVRVWLTHGAVALAGKIYVTGGQTRRFDEKKQVYVGATLRSLYVYNPSSDSWTRRADLPILAFGAGVSAMYKGFLYVATACHDPTICGSREDLGALWRYNPANNNWVLLTRTPHDPTNGGGGFIGGKLYLISEAGGQATDVYTVATNSWSTGPQRPGSTCLPSYATANAKLYVTCPASGGGTALDVLDPGTGWSSAGPIPHDAGGPAYTMSRVVRGGRTVLELVGGSYPTNNLQYAP
jgi:hypothetical protein